MYKWISGALFAFVITALMTSSDGKKKFKRHHFNDICTYTNDSSVDDKQCNALFESFLQCLEVKPPPKPTKFPTTTIPTTAIKTTQALNETTTTTKQKEFENFAYSNNSEKIFRCQCPKNTSWEKALRFCMGDEGISCKSHPIWETQVCRKGKCTGAHICNFAFNFLPSFLITLLASLINLILRIL